MQIGEKVRSRFRRKLGLGVRGYPGDIRPNATLLFEANYSASHSVCGRADTNVSHTHFFKWRNAKIRAPSTQMTSREERIRRRFRSILTRANTEPLPKLACQEWRGWFFSRWRGPSATIDQINGIAYDHDLWHAITVPPASYVSRSRLQTMLELRVHAATTNRLKRKARARPPSLFVIRGYRHRAQCTRGDECQWMGGAFASNQPSKEP